MPSSSDRSSEPPVIEVGEDVILIEESWLDREWSELLEVTDDTPLPRADGAPTLPAPALLQTAEATLACTTEWDGVLLAAIFEAGAGRILVDRSGNDRREESGALTAMAYVWKSCSDLALAQGAPVEELVVRNDSTFLAYRRVAGTPLVLCVLFDRTKTNDALIHMNLCRLCG